MNNANTNTTQPLGAITKFLVEAGGASAVLAAHSPSNLRGLVANGAMVTATAAFAGLSVALEAHRTTHSKLATGIAFGLWASIIFIVDRLLLTKMHEHAAEALNDQKTERRGLMVASRLVMICVFSFLFSQLFLQALFASSLTTELKTIAQEAGQQATAQADAQFGPEIKRLETANAALDEQVKEKETLRAAKYDAWIAEAEGTAGSGVKGQGQLFRQKQEELQRAEEDLAATRTAIATDKAKYTEELKAVRAQRQTAIQTVAESAGATDDVLARNRALWRIIRRDFGALAFFMLLMLGLMALESTALITELMSPSHEYIKLLANEKKVEAGQRDAQLAIATDAADKSKTAAKDQQAHVQEVQQAVWQKVAEALAQGQTPNVGGPLLSVSIAVEDYLRQTVLSAVPPAPPVSEQMTAEPASVLVRVISPDPTQPDVGYKVNFNRHSSQAHLLTLRDLEAALHGSNLPVGNHNAPLDLSQYRLVTQSGVPLKYDQPLFKQLSGDEVHLLP